MANIILVTCPDDATARSIAKTLVEENLAACVNILNDVTSIYRWEGNVAEENERLLLIKTAVKDPAGLEARIKELHPYEVPEYVVISPDYIGQPYRDWLEDSGF